MTLKNVEIVTKPENDMTDHAASYWIEAGYSEGGALREVDYAALPKGLPKELEGIKIVDTDTHVVEYPDLFLKNAPVQYRDKVPHVVRVNGVDRWKVGDKDFGSLGGNVIRADHQKLIGRLSFPALEQGHPGAWQVKERLQAMDDMGVYAQICFQNSGVTQAGSLMALGDNDLAVTILKLYNDASIERQQESGQRLFTMAHLPLWDQKAMMAEAERVLDAGLRGFVLPDTPERLGVPSFNTDYWTPFLELCNERGAPLNFHLNAAVDPNTMTWQGFEFEQKLSVIATMFSICNSATIGNWMVSGRLDQFPKLKIGLIETGIGWIPFAIEALEHQFREMMGSCKVQPQRRPWEYFRDHFKATFWFEEYAPMHMVDKIGVNNIMFETDFPHPTCLYPGVQEHLVKVLGHHPYEVRKQILERNAAELYNLPF